TKRFQHLRHDSRDRGSLRDDSILALTIDHAGNVWVGTAHGLDRWDAAQHSFGGAAIGGQGSQILEDQSGSIWASSFDRGLMELDGAGRLIRAFHHDARRSDSLGSDDVRAVLEDQAGHLWVGTADGLDLLDRSSGLFDHYRQDPNDPESLRDS